MTQPCGKDDGSGPAGQGELERRISGLRARLRAMAAGSRAEFETSAELAAALVEYHESCHGPGAAPATPCEAATACCAGADLDEAIGYLGRAMRSAQQ